MSLSQSTPVLSLPLIQGGQAQKHVTHNEAIEILDTLVQPVAADHDRTEPPAQPDDGDCHLVAPGGAGAWIGQDHALAVFSNGGWVFHAPRAGWRVHVLALGADVVFDGSAWQVPGGAGAPETLGVNTAADTTNRLAVAAPATLLTHEGAGHQVKVNKAATTDTNSLLFQTDWSGRAEMGCAGSDDFAIKVSADGGTWHDGLVIDAATGAARFPGGLAGTGSAAGPLGGQVVALVGERNSGFGIGTHLSFGNGASNPAGPALPFNAKIMAASLSISGGSVGLTTMAVALGEVAQPGFSVVADFDGTGAATGVADFSGAPLLVPAGQPLSLVCTDTVGAAKVIGTIFAVFD